MLDCSSSYCPNRWNLIRFKQMQPTQDLRVIGMQRLRTPRLLKEKLPMSERANQTVVNGRGAVQRILRQQDTRLLVVVGPCSAHDPKGALEYANKLAELTR